VFRDFNVQIVTTRPASPASYLEIMVGGTPQQVGLSAGYGGVAPFKCQSYEANALVFDFANVYNGAVEDICATAAQEIAHTWSLDHSTDKTDPLTYYTYTARKYFDNVAQQCGSDCVNGISPNNQQCTGSPPQLHPCSCTGQSTQNSYQKILSNFGMGQPAPPTVTIKYPNNNQDVAAGFNVTAEVSSIYGGQSKAQLLVDNQPVLTINSPPYAFNAPAGLTPGAHTVTVIGTDFHGVTAMTSITAQVVASCTKPGDCPNNTDVCAAGLCEPGSSVQGGLGTTCTDNTSCASGQCAADDTGKMLCTVSCDPATSGACPGGFDCLQAGASGVCWPSSGGGGCDASGGGPLMFGLAALAGLLVTRRRRG
jgi:uncharacterized protein (TIGR03382 family)